MFAWAEIALLVLKIANAIINQLNQEKFLQAGRDAEIAKVSADILRKTQIGKALWEKVDALGDPEVDNWLRDLEPRNPRPL